MPSSRRSSKAKVSRETDMISLSQQISEMRSEDLLVQPFTLVSFQYAVVNHGQCYPCEVGAVQFSLSGGIQKAYHTFVSPKPLPSGTFAEAKQHADETHQLPFLSDFPFWNTDWVTISENLFAMIDGSCRVFSKTSGDELKVTAGSLEYLDLKSGSGISDVSVSPIERLVECIARRFNVCITSPDEIEKYLSRSVHDFDPNIRCFYHEGEDSHHCAYATVLRLFFNMIDFMNEKHVIRADPAFLKVPDCFVSRYQSKGPASRHCQNERGGSLFGSTTAPQEIGWKANLVHAGGEQPLDDEDSISDTATVVNEALSQSFADGQAPLVMERESFTGDTRNGGPSVSGNTGAHGRIQPTGAGIIRKVEVIQLGGPSRVHYLPKTYMGITVEPLGDRPMVFCSADE